MLSMTTFAANLALAFMFTGGTATRPTVWYAALHTADPGAEGTANEVLVASDADYVRKQVTFSTPASRQSTNSADLTFTPAIGAAAYTVTHMSVWDAATGGNCLSSAAMLVSRTIDSTSPLVIATGDFIEAIN